MTEWLRQFCLDALMYGLDTVNVIMNNIMTIIVNLYGKRLFRVNDSEIIKKYHHDADYNYFYLCDFNLNDMEQIIGDNSLKIEQGVIQDPVVVVPRILITANTTINIATCHADISLTTAPDDLNLSNSYMIDSQRQSGSLLNVYQEIHALLLQYFNNICVNIATIHLTFMDQLIIKMSHVTYMPQGKTATTIANIHIQLVASNTVVQLYDVHITPDYEVTIHKVVIDRLHITNITCNYRELAVTSMVITDVVTTGAVCIHRNDNNYTIHNPVQVEIYDWNELINWINQFKTITAEWKFFTAHHVAIWMITGVNVITNLGSISVNKICRDNDVMTLDDVAVTYQDVHLKCDRIVVNGKITGEIITATSPLFQLQSQQVVIEVTDMINVHFTKAHLVGLTPFIAFIKSLMKPPSDTKPLEVNIYISESVIVYQSGDINFDIVVTACHCHQNFHYMTNVQINVVVNNHLLATCNSNHSTLHNFDIELLRIHVDPVMYDVINRLITTNSVALSQTIIAETIEDMETSLANSIPKLLLDLTNNLIDDYRQPTVSNDVTISIHAIHCYLFDKLPVEDTEDTAFICIIVKDIVMKKYQEDDKVIYLLNVTSGAVVDLTNCKSSWKYIVKFVDDTAMLHTRLTVQDEVYRCHVHVNSPIFNIREEILLRLLAFFTIKDGVVQDKTVIEHFDINMIDITLSYYPLILQDKKLGGLLTLKDCKIKLSRQLIMNTRGVDKLVKIVVNQWLMDLNLNNVHQFIPNLKIISPCTATLTSLLRLVNQYFKHPHNKRKIHAITKNINKSINLVTLLMKLGINQLIELFD